MLYSKKYQETEYNLKDAFLFTSDNFEVFKKNYENYENVYCLEVDIINKIKLNEEGFFDFSKNLIDVGAAIGEYCSCLDFNTNYIFEPDKELMWTCQANLVNKDKVKNSFTYQVALSDKEGKETIFTNGREEFWETETKTLDSYNFKNVGFIKIDVEGFEEKVIRGGLITIISNNYPPILFECWNIGWAGMTQEKRDSLFNLLKTLGYEIFECWGDYETHLAVHKTKLNK